MTDEPLNQLHMPAVAPMGRQEIDRHLVIVHQDGWQAIEDWQEIAEGVQRIDPRIAVFIVESSMRNSASTRQAAQRPTLVVSPGPMGRFAPIRGRVFHGTPMPKMTQLSRLARAGVPVPTTAVLTPGLELDPAVWGDVVILKPADLATSSKGNGIQLMRTRKVSYLPPEEYPEGHPGRRGPMLVQRFIDTGPHVVKYRVLTLFGQALYCLRSQGRHPRPPLTVNDKRLEAIQIADIAIPDTVDRFVEEIEILNFASLAYRAMPEVPLQGCDIVRDAATGRMFVLELNPGGNTWHFSSGHNTENRIKNGVEFENTRRTHLDAFGTAAKVLADRTRRLAV